MLKQQVHKTDANLRQLRNRSENLVGDKMKAPLLRGQRNRLLMPHKGCYIKQGMTEPAGG